MERNRRLVAWLPVIIAVSIVVGIFIGNNYYPLTRYGGHRLLSGGNKINTILNIIDKQYVDTVDMEELVESTIPKIFGELDPHSEYIFVTNGANSPCIFCFIPMCIAV